MCCLLAFVELFVVEIICCNVKCRKRSSCCENPPKSALKDGKQIPWLPFVSKGNLRDKLFLLHSLSAQPMHASHGKVDGEIVRNDNLAMFTAMSDNVTNWSSGKKSTPKKQHKANTIDAIAGMQDMVNKKHEAYQQRLAIACKKLEFAEKEENHRSKNMGEWFAIQHCRINVQQQQLAEQHQHQAALLQQVISQQQSSESFNKMVVENQRLMMEIIAKTMGTTSSANAVT
jgi:hypothetical protein